VVVQKALVETDVAHLLLKSGMPPSSEESRLTRQLLVGGAVLEVAVQVMLPGEAA